MTVKELIAELRTMPKNLEVYMAAHDNSEWEVQDDVNRAILVDLREMDEDEPNPPLQEMPTRWVVLRS
jgi:hypothetical protein